MIQKCLKSLELTCRLENIFEHFFNRRKYVGSASVYEINHWYLLDSQMYKRRLVLNVKQVFFYIG